MKTPLAASALGMRGHADHPGRGIAFALAGIFIFSSQDAIAKWLAADYPVMEIIFFRALFALVPAAVFMFASGGFQTLRTQRLRIHLIRSFMLTGALACYYLAIRTIPLADAVAIVFAAPLFMTALSVPILGERVGPRRWAAVMIGFLGVIVVAHPGSELFGTAAILVVISSAFYAGAMIATRGLTRTDTSAAILIYHYLVSIAVAGAILPFQWVTPTPGDAVAFVTIGLMGGVGAFCAVQGFRYAAVSVIAPFDYTMLLWATLYGWLLWSDLPGPAVLAGVAIIVASNLYILHRETRAGKREKSNAATP